MNKYSVQINYTEYYKPEIIEAKDETEAEEKYQELVDNGMVETVGGDYHSLEVTKV